MLRSILSKIFAKIIYPANLNDWYKNKGYKGKTDFEIFTNFLSAQNKKGSTFYEEFISLNITRHHIKSGKNYLDSVFISPTKEIAYKKPGDGFLFVMFYGKNEPYEIRFRDMARQSKETGASILAFNPKGLCSSSGKTEILPDIVEDGIAVISFILQKKVPYERIILQGNSLGAGIQEMVSEHYRKIYHKPLYQINSNSFLDIGSVIAYYYKMPFLKKLFSIILKYANWEIYPGKDFYKTGPYRCHVYRKGDMIIHPKARYNNAINFTCDNNNCPEFYKETHQWLYKHSQTRYLGKTKQDPHYMALNCFYIKTDNNYLSVYHLINRYLLSIRN